MTCGTENKRTILETWRKSYQHDFPNGVTTVIKDAMPQVKYKGPHITTIQKYIHEHVLKPVKDILDDPNKNVQNYYMLLDRGGNIAKRIFTSGKRDRVTPMPEPDPKKFKFVLPTEGFLPQDWEALIANRELTKREVYHLYYRAVMEVYTPPVNKCVVLDGAPPRQLDKADYDLNKETIFSNLYLTRTLPHNPDQPVQMSAHEIMSTPMASKPTTIRVQCDPSYSHNIQEGDLSAFYHVNNHIRYPGCVDGVAPHQSIMIDSNDGDTLWIALLHARDRIDPATFEFNSRVWVKLQGQKATREAYERKVKAAAEKGEVYFDVIDGRDVYINVNKLYVDIERDPIFCKAQYPQAMVVLLNILAGTDFFGDFHGDEYGLFYDVGWKPYVWETWKTHNERFANMVMVFYNGQAISNQPKLLRRPFIDEDAMIVFIYQCYAAKYGARIKKLKNSKVVTQKDLIEFTNTFSLNCKRKKDEPDEKFNKRMNKAKKKRIPPDCVLIRYIRLALLNMTYWINDYRPDGSTICNPLEEYEGLPYYGFIKDSETGQITLSPVCSPAKPIPGYYAQHTGGHLRQDREERRQAALARRAAAEAKKAEEARETERLVRQNAMLQRERMKKEKEQAIDARARLMKPLKREREDLATTMEFPAPLTKAQIKQLPAIPQSKASAINSAVAVKKESQQAAAVKRLRMGE